MAPHLDPLRGIHYRSQWFYYFQNVVKLGFDYDLRFKIAAQRIIPGESVLDVCAGPGQLKQYLPDGCHYSAIEASPQFNEILSRKGVSSKIINLHQGFIISNFRVDAVVMIVSLCHFRDSSLSSLLEGFKKVGKRVVIVEDVLEKPRGERSVFQKAMNHLCAVDYYRPARLFTAGEFQETMRVHGYACAQHTRRYWVGTFESPIGPK